LVIASGFFLVAFLHQDYWIRNELMGIQYQYLFAATFLFGFLWCTFTTMSRMKPALRPCHFEFAAGVALLGLCSLLLPDAWQQLWLILVLFSGPTRPVSWRRASTDTEAGVPRASRAGWRQHGSLLRLGPDWPSLHVLVQRPAGLCGAGVRSLRVPDYLSSAPVFEAMTVRAGRRMLVL
jgi:hypothetical protein